MRWLVVVLVGFATACGNEVSAPFAVTAEADNDESSALPGDPPRENADADSDPDEDIDPSDTEDTDAPTCTALLCDDFEASDTLDTSRWTTSVGYNPAHTLTVQTARVAHGERAVLAHLAEEAGGFSSIKEFATFPELADVLWGRIYFYTTIPLAAGHSGFISAFDGSNRFFEIGYSKGKWQLTRYWIDGGYHEAPHGSSKLVPRETWVCLEWMFDRSADDGESFMELYIDGEPVETYASGGELVPAMTGVGIGIDNHAATPGQNDVYIDDVAIDDTRVGCLD